MAGYGVASSGNVPHFVKLTDAIIRETRAPKKGYRALTDGKRLFLRIDSRGRRSWRLKYVVGGR